MNSLGEKLRKAREERNLILRKVSAAVDIDQSLISKFEKNERKPTQVQLKSLASFYELDEKELIIDWYSEKIAYDLQGAEFATEILKIAEEKINYYSSKKNGKK